MSKKHRTAAHFKRRVMREAGPDMFELTIAMAQPMSDSARTTAETGCELALKALESGTATASDYNDLLEGISTAHAHTDHIEDVQTRLACLDVTNAATVALTEIRQRFIDTGKLGMNWRQRQALRDGLDLYYQLLANCTRGQLVTAYKQAQQEIKVEVAA